MKKLLLLLAFLSSPAFAVVIGGNQTATSTLNAINMNPSVTPIQRVDVTFEFDASDPVAPGEAFKVDVYQGSQLIGTDTYQNTSTENVLSCACIEVDAVVTSNPFSIEIAAVTGSMDISLAKVVAYDFTASDPAGESEVINASLAIGGVPPGDLGYGIVYTRADRAYLPYDVPDTEYTFPDRAYKDGTWDTRKVGGDVNTSSVVYNSLDGDVRILNEEPGAYGPCVATNVASEACSAGEARVSPDGNQILYQVTYNYSQLTVADTGSPGDVNRWNYTNIPSTSCVYHYDLTTRVTTPWPCTDRVSDRQPTWISNTKVVFASSRPTDKIKTVNNKTQGYPPAVFGSWDGLDPFAQTLAPNSNAATPSYKAYYSLKLWTANWDGSNPEILTPHDDVAIRPFVMPNGDILYTCMEQQDDLGYDAPNKTNFPGSLGNNAWLCRVNQDGGDIGVLFGGHELGDTQIFTGGVAVKNKVIDIRAIRGVGYDSVNKWIYVNNYYTGTHSGLGSLWRFKIPLDVPTIEGNNGRWEFTPDTLEVATPWAQDADFYAYYDPNEQKPMGVSGYYVQAPNAMALITWGRGDCWNSPPDYTTWSDPEYMNGEPTCDMGIYKIDPSTIPNGTPFRDDMVKIVDELEYHENDADVVAPYSQKYPGYSAPLIQDNSDTITEGSNECYLNVVNINNGELAQHEYKWFDGESVNGETYWKAGRDNCKLPLGCGSPEKTPAEIESLVIYGLLYEDDRNTNYNMPFVNTIIRETYMGEAQKHADGSIRAKVPCETPFKMAGLDADGRQIFKDQIAQSLRPGEDRFCWGCHDGHSEERAIELGAPANSSRLAFQGTDADVAPDPAILDGDYSPTYLDDIQPMLETTCRGCHSNSYNDVMYGLPTLYGWNALAADHWQQLVWPQSKKVTGWYGSKTSSIRRVFIPEQGTGYQEGDPIVFDSGSGSGQVTSVDANGAITGATASGGDYGHGKMPNASVSSATGTGASVSVSILWHRLDRPYTSRYINKFAVNSLLYWKCINERADGWTDATHGGDIDYGTETHVSGATPEQCDMLGKWIEMGSRYN